jgi:dihydrodipicolinate synthase/N-acetylneuraminate lyase
MYTAEDLSGLMAMMPAFATPDAHDIRATNTVDVGNLREGLDRMIRDGAGVISTMGSFGECHTLLWDEFTTVAREALDVAQKRVPIFIGCTSPNSREVYQKMLFAREAGAEGVLLGMPYYDTATADNIARFYTDIAEAFPEISIMIYHNPVNHKVHIPVAVFNKLVQHPSIVGMKDSHRTPLEFQRLQDIISGKISVFVNQAQLVPHMELGARGCWSIDAWMGPWPVLSLLRATREGDTKTAMQIIAEITEGRVGGGDRAGVPTDSAGKLGIGFAGYCNPGPLRPPFMEVSEESLARVKRRAEYWKGLCAKYRPQVEALAAV